MARTSITLEIDPSHESLLRNYASYLDELKSLAAAAPHGAVLAMCEQAVVQQGREHQRRALEQAVQACADEAEKKGRR